MRTRTEENVAMTDEHVLSQEDQTQIRHSTRPIAQSAAMFSSRSWLEERPAEYLTEAISYATALENSC